MLAAAHKHCLGLFQMEALIVLQIWFRQAKTPSSLSSTAPAGPYACLQCSTCAHGLTSVHFWKASWLLFLPGWKAS